MEGKIVDRFAFLFVVFEQSIYLMIGRMEHFINSQVEEA
jgi:hypothetical protein